MPGTSDKWHVITLPDKSQTAWFGSADDLRRTLNSAGFDLVRNREVRDTVFYTAVRLKRSKRSPREGQRGIER